MAYETLKVRITGVRDLLMHRDDRFLDFRDPLNRQFKALSAKRKKSDEDMELMARLEWELGLYHDPQIGPYLPPVALHRCVQNAAKSEKKGPTVVAGLIFEDPYIRLDYDGPRDIEGLYADGGFLDLRPAKVQMSRVPRARAIFREWAATFSVAFDAETLNRDEMVRYIDRAGTYFGLLDYRPTYGRFSAKILEGGK